MTQAILAQSALTGGNGFTASPIERVRLGLRRFRRYHSTRIELDRLSDRELADISIRRSDINAIARQAAEQDV